MALDMTIIFLPEGNSLIKVLKSGFKEIPIYISHASGHMGCANDAALALAGITKRYTRSGRW